MLRAMPRWSLAPAGLLAAVLGLVLVHAGPSAATLPRSRVRYGVDIQAVFDVAGDPLAVANFSPDGDLAIPRWTVCRPGKPCRRIPSHDREVRPGPEPSGTRFVATATYRGRRYSASVTWHGAVHALTAPTVTGPLRDGAVLHIHAASWAGGWGAEFDQLGAEACRTRTARGCRLLAGGELGCPDASSHRRLGGWFTGAYVFALDARKPRDLLCAGTGYFANADLRLWPLGPTVVRSPVLGRIAGPPRPTVAFLARAIVTGRDVLVARVRCLNRCAVYVDVVDGETGATSSARFTGTRRVGVRRAALHGGQLTVNVHVDDSPELRGRSRLPARAAGSVRGRGDTHNATMAGRVRCVRGADDRCRRLWWWQRCHAHDIEHAGRF